MKKVAGNQHLLRRKGVYYYRRRVPLHLVKEIGKKFIQRSLNTTSLAEAKKFRALSDLEWDARFDSLKKDAATAPGSATSQPTVNSTQLSEGDLLRLVRDFVERKDEEFRKRFADNPPQSEREEAEMTMEAKLDAQIIRDRDDPQADQWVYSTGKEILHRAGKSIDDPALPHAAFAEWVRRGLLELDRRNVARLADDHRHAFFDQLFNPTRQPRVSFGELADQYLRLTGEDAATNHLSQKGIDRQRATMALNREILGDSTPVDAVDYDACLRVRSTLARIPANRTKIYGTRPLDEVIKRAAAENKAVAFPGHPATVPRGPARRTRSGRKETPRSSQSGRGLETRQTGYRGRKREAAAVHARADQAVLPKQVLFRMRRAPGALCARQVRLEVLAALDLFIHRDAAERGRPDAPE